MKSLKIGLVMLMLLSATSALAQSFIVTPPIELIIKIKKCDEANTRCHAGATSILEACLAKCKTSDDKCQLTCLSQYLGAVGGCSIAHKLCVGDASGIGSSLNSELSTEDNF